LPPPLTEKGASVPTIGLALTLVFACGAAGKLACAFIGARIGVVATVFLTEALTTVAILALLLLPLDAGLLLLPVIGVLKGSVELGVSVLIVGKCAVPNGRSTFLVDHLKRPTFTAPGQSVYLHAHGNSVAGHAFAERRGLNFRGVVIDHLRDLTVLRTRAEGSRCADRWLRVNEYTP
jgi:hypothetical protein